MCPQNYGCLWNYEKLPKDSLKVLSIKPILRYENLQGDEKRKAPYSVAVTCFTKVNFPLTTLKITMGLSTDPSRFRVILPP